MKAMSDSDCLRHGVWCVVQHRPEVCDRQAEKGDMLEVLYTVGAPPMVLDMPTNVACL